MVRADRSRLKQLVEHLLRNAIDRGSSPGAVTVDGLEDDGGFHIEDDGPGIPAEKHDQVFEVGASSSEAGTGIGLSIVQRIVDAHDWRGHVMDGEQGGARFAVVTGAADE